MKAGESDMKTTNHFVLNNLMCFLISAFVCAGMVLKFKCGTNANRQGFWCNSPATIIISDSAIFI